MLSTYVFDAANFQFIKKINGLTALGGVYPPDFFISANSKYIFIEDRFKNPSLRGIAASALVWI